MRVLVDARSLASGRGIGRYTQRLLEAATAGPPTGIPADWHVALPADGVPSAALSPGLTAHRSRLPSRALHGLAAATGRPRLDALAAGADVVWLPAVAPVAVSPSIPVVLTVHDLSFLQRPADFTAYERAWHRAARVTRQVTRAAAVVCDSRAVAAEVTARWPQVSRRVHVVAPGVDRPPPGPVAALPAGLPERFFLVVGALEPRKAPQVVTTAFAAARAAGLDAGLVFAGTGRCAATLAGPGVHVVGRVTDPVLHALYARALALLMPSWLEGFGLPPLEAALHGTPSVVSDLPVFGETIGAGALRVRAGDDRALADALLRLAGDPGLRARLAVTGARAAAPLTWSRSAAALTAVLAGAAR